MGSILQKCRTAAALSLLLLSFLVGCSSVATQKKFYQPIVTELRRGNYTDAAKQIEAAREKGKYKNKDRFLYFLDAGLAYHYAGEYELSNAKLSLAEEAAEELFTKSVSRALLSVSVLNDNVLEYAGEDYEVLYTNLIKALNYTALGKHDDALVEVKRANLKLNLLEDKYADVVDQLNQSAREDSNDVGIEYDFKQVRFYNDAFARYLSMHIYSADNQPDDARIDYDFLHDAFRTQPHIYDFSPPLVRYESGQDALLSIVALTGLAPVKEALNLRIRTDKDLNLVQVLYTDGPKKDSEYGHFALKVNADYYFKFALPSLALRPTDVQSIRIAVDSSVVGELHLVEDLDRVAIESFEARKSIVYLRTIARAVAKGIAAHKLKKKVDTGGLEGWLKKAAIDYGADLTENADLRCSRLLPGRVYVGDFELATGTYAISVDFFDSNGDKITTRRFENYVVASDRLNLIEVVALQ